MKQVLIKKGAAHVATVPVPNCGDNEILVAVKYSLISTGTEMSGVIESGKPLLERAKQHPEHVALVLDTVKRQGLKKTYDVIRGALDMGLPTGYSAAGEVVAVGRNITTFTKGDRVACAGAGKANHAEYIAVPKNLVVKIPENLSYADAASVTIGAIALQGVRQANPELGDTVVVSGLGLIGLIATQLLVANGCRVIGIDPDAKRRQQAEQFGAFLTAAPGKTAVTAVLQATHNHGADRIVITAATSSSEPVNDAMAMVRKRGTVVVVGAVGMDIQRSPFYEKEVTFTISCSYGPGRYDRTYEAEGHDYPYGFVRWTENRNMQAYLQLLADKKVNFSVIAEGEYVLNEASNAYAALKTPGVKPLAVLLKYADDPAPLSQSLTLSHVHKRGTSGPIRVAVIGAGGFATGMHLPNLQKLKQHFTLQAIVDHNAAKVTQLGQRYGATVVATNYHEILPRTDIDAVIITTRHDQHANVAIDCLKAGKAVFVEKPMALTPAELTDLVTIITETKQPFMVGFNRRFSPFAKKLKTVLASRTNPAMLTYRMNAGYIPLDHWVHNAAGGGRIIGEACHILDLFTYLLDAAPIQSTIYTITPKTDYYSATDNASITVTYNDGSVATLLYTALGHPKVSKEQLEAYFDGNTVIMDDYRTMESWGVQADLHLTTQDKGHVAELEAFAHALKHGTLPIPLDELIATTQLTFDLTH